jgi:hypothetical protein
MRWLRYDFFFSHGFIPPFNGMSGTTVEKHQQQEQAATVMQDMAMQSYLKFVVAEVL